MIKNKKASALMWIIIILILIALGIGAYFLFFGGNSIPQPPSLPSG